MSEVPYIYFIRSGKKGAIKIGITTDVLDRMEKLQVGNAEDLILLGLIEGDKEIEQRIQLSFRNCLIRGEWFKPVSTLLEFIKKRAKLPKTLKKKFKYKNITYCKDVELENPMQLDFMDGYNITKPLTETQIDSLFAYLPHEVREKIDFISVDKGEKLEIIRQNIESLNPIIKKKGFILKQKEEI